MFEVKVEQENNVDVKSPATVDFPDGGWQAWATIAGAFLLYKCFGVFQDFYEIGWIGGAQICLNFAVGALAGRIFDRGYLYHLMIGSIFLMRSGNQYYQVFLSQGLCISIGCGLSYVPSLGIISHYFSRRRALAAGIVSAGSALGAILHPIMLNKLFNSHIGFHNGVRISGGLNVFLLIVATFLMRTRLPPKKENTGSHFPIVRYIKDIPYALVLLGGVFAFCGLFFPIFYLQLDAVLHGVDTNLAFYAISILNAASFFGRIIPNALAPRFGVFQLMMVSLSGAGVIILAMIAVKDAVGVILFGIFYGFLTGAAISLVPPMIALVAEDVNEIGTRMGIYFLFAGMTASFILQRYALTDDCDNQTNPIFGCMYFPCCIIMMVASGLAFGAAGFLAMRRKRAKREQESQVSDSQIHHRSDAS
ncbi:major facilitator superfamily domain-containing protein [Cyathus striatus]|nr:major facilitator superfamily domain-containing protein [Cyathus striatus]